ncbi:MAG TPA: prepilin-type N-terminal cleavage/methylation domain-containing protein [Polyangiaceae bacterium]
MTRRGFTLLEVLVAISILGLGLTVILSSQTGMFASAVHSEKLTHAVFLARCKMTETELELMTDGYPLIDQNDSGKCCEDDDSEYTCSWRVEKIELPQPGSFVPPEGEGADPDAGLGDVPGTVDPAELGGNLSALSAVQGLENPSGLPGQDPLNSLAALGSEDGAAGIGAMVMTLVYPELKPMLEASIRKVTVTVHWKEGTNDKDFSVTQYVTDPQEGGLLDTTPEPNIDPDDPSAAAAAAAFGANAASGGLP